MTRWLVINTFCKNVNVFLCVLFCGSIVLLSHQGGRNAGWEEQKHRTGAGKSYSRFFSLMTGNIYLTRLRPLPPPTSPPPLTFFWPTIQPLLAPSHFCFAGAPERLANKTESWPRRIIGVLARQISSHSAGASFRAENKWLGKCDMRLSTTFLYKGNVVNSSRLNSASGGGERKKQGKKNRTPASIKMVVFLKP